MRASWVSSLRLRPGTRDDKSSLDLKGPFLFLADAIA
jgi:hypothetical protein